jgi:hypothetical protein
MAGFLRRRQHRLLKFHRNPGSHRAAIRHSKFRLSELLMTVRYSFHGPILIALASARRCRH